MKYKIHLAPNQLRMPLRSDTRLDYKSLSLCAFV